MAEPQDLPARFTHQHEGELVVFHIGLTIHRWWRPDQWLPPFLAMPPMLRELAADPGSGLLGHELLVGRHGPYVVQYWSSLEKLLAYASDSSRRHRPAWTRFTARARSHAGAVGIWHETFTVAAAESLYVGTPRMGLPAATTLRPVEKRHHRARARLADGGTTAPMP